jgi:hypothetical protein
LEDNDVDGIMILKIISIKESGNVDRPLQGATFINIAITIIELLL